MPEAYLSVVVTMGLVTYIPRWLPLFFLTKYSLAGWFKEWLALIPAAILSALLIPALVTAGEPKHLAFMRPELWVAIPTFIVAIVSKSLGGTVVVGMGLYWIATVIL